VLYFINTSKVKVHLGVVLTTKKFSIFGTKKFNKIAKQASFENLINDTISPIETRKKSFLSLLRQPL
jgi:hypothetical protein